MKQIKLFFLIFIICICIIGCDEGMIDPMQLVDIVSQYETTVQSELPDEVLAAMKIQADNMSEWVRIQLTAPVTDELTDERTFMRDNGYDKIDYFYELQKAYYTKYIDAAGIAIVAPQHIRSKYLIDARDAIVVMTSKHPELRERLLAKHGKFYMVLIPSISEQRDMPEGLLGLSRLNDDPYDDFLTNSCHGSVLQTGLCWASVNIETSSAKIFVHEFAHALQWEMEHLQPGFEDKLREYYRGRGGSLPWYEYWARSVEAWFYISPLTADNKYEEFIEKYGVLGETLDYWFPRVRLNKEIMPFVIPDDLTVIPKQAYAIFEKHCFECHGENGTHKDVLVIESGEQLFWDAGVIVDGDPDASILFRRILGHPAYGPQMPLGKPPLSEEEIDIIETWLNFFSHVDWK